MRKLLICALLLFAFTAPVVAQQPATARLPTNIFTIMGIKGDDYTTARIHIDHGESWRRQDWANKYLVIDREHSWSYELTATDIAANDWYRADE